MDIQSLVMAWLIPIVILVILTFTVIEASSASEYRTLPGMNKEQLLSARIMQKSNLVRKIIVMERVKITRIIFQDLDSNESLTRSAF